VQAPLRCGKWYGLVVKDKVQTFKEPSSNRFHLQGSVAAYLRLAALAFKHGNASLIHCEPLGAICCLCIYSAVLGGTPYAVPNVQARASVML
jgi:hypothetical protein